MLYAASTFRTLALVLHLRVRHRPLLVQLLRSARHEKSSSPCNAAVARLLIVLLLLGAVIAPVVHAQVNFSTPPTFAGRGPVFVADFNGDGKPDILARTEP